MGEKHEDAALILRLYELRREEVMRKARTWYIREFNPGSLADVSAAAMGEQSAYYRMVTTYWDMAASLVNHGAIDEQMFNDANGEHIAVFAKLEPFLPEIREVSGMPNYLHNLESVVMRIPDAKERMTKFREQIKMMTAKEADTSKAQAG
jgi:hypothetical protein